MEPRCFPPVARCSLKTKSFSDLINFEMRQNNKYSHGRDSNVDDISTNLVFAASGYVEYHISGKPIYIYIYLYINNMN